MLGKIFSLKIVLPLLFVFISILHLAIMNRILSSMSSKELQETNRFLLYSIYAAYLIFPAAAFAVGAYIANVANKINKSTQKMIGNNFDEPVSWAGYDEVSGLAESFEEMRNILKTRISVLEEEKNKAEAIVFNVAEAIYAVNLYGEIIMFNNVAEKITGVKRESALRQNHEQIVVLLEKKSENKLSGFINKVLLEGQIISLPPARLLTADRALIPVLVNASPIRNNHGLISGAIVVLRDITQEAELEEMRADLISIASHQLRTPLSEIKGLTSLIDTGIGGSVTPRQKEYLSLINIATERMLKLVNDLLDISRIEQGRMKLSIQRVNLGILAKEVSQQFLSKAQAQRQNLQVTIDPQSLPNVLADPEKTTEIMSNLIDNALKYTPSGGTILVRVLLDRDKVWFLVRDSGVGIPKEKQKDLFKKFSRIQSPLAKTVSGTGLGLYVAKQLTERQGGKVYVDSQDGQGSTFSFFLPVAKEGDQERYQQNVRQNTNRR